MHVLIGEERHAQWGQECYPAQESVNAVVVFFT